MLTACQNSEELSPQPFKAEPMNSIASKTSLEGANEKDILSTVSDYMTTNKLPGGGGAIINCHTEYNTWEGHACVSSGGYLFQVSWHGTYEYVSPGNWQYVTQYWAGDPVSSCGC